MTKLTGFISLFNLKLDLSTLMLNFFSSSIFDIKVSNVTLPISAIIAHPQSSLIDAINNVIRGIKYRKAQMSKLNCLANQLI